ncbi:MAG: hypothetical protein EB020_12200, partial [Proteobacteria bacterium]|nr:hypothetical protein [Pseudomonadota bacterium]
QRGTATLADSATLRFLTKYELPITALLGEVIDGTLDPREAGARLLGRRAGRERVDDSARASLSPSG